MRSSEKIKRNFIIGIVSELLTILLGVVIPRLVLTSYGSEVNGLINSVTQIYSYIALLEAGIGGATIQALYKSLGINDKEKTNAILAATNAYYHKTGLLYLIAILLFSILYPCVVTSEIPSKTIVLIIVFNGLGNVINYFFQGKYALLLQAEGKNYIRTTLNMIINLLRNIAKIILINCGFDVVLVQAISMAISLIQMVYIIWYIRKNYTWIDLKVTPDYNSISQSKNVLVHQLSTLVFNNTDSIILTLFCGLKTVSVYALYTMLFSMIKMALSTVSGSVTFVLGQSFHANRERFIKYYDCYEICYMTSVFVLCSIANFFILPFLSCYTSGVADINYIDNYLPTLFIVIYLLDGGRSSCVQVISFAGHFRQTQNRSLIESAINIIVSLVAVQFWGIYGVLFGTIVALFYRTNDMIFYANKKILERSAWITYKRWMINTVIYVFVVYMNRFIPWDINGYKDIFIYLIPYSLTTCVVFFGVMLISEIRMAKFVFDLIQNRLKKGV